MSSAPPGRVPSVIKPPLEGCRVLLVEDDPADADLFGMILFRAGAKVTLAGDGETAAPMVGVNGYHVCVVDLVLPGMRGLELVATVKAGGFKGALVGLSGHLTDEITELWYAAGCDAVLDKAADADRLVATVARVCQSYGRD